MTNFVLGPLQTKWLEELELGKHKQCKKTLGEGEAYCCLGIARKFVLGRDLSLYPRSFLHEEDVKDLGLYSDEGHPYPGARTTEPSLATMNDGGSTFEEIATIIRANPEKYFKESR